MIAYVDDHVKETVRAQALALGFSACGFTSAEPLDCDALLAAWLTRERHGFMDYLARFGQRRTRPRAVLSEAQTVIVVAWPYAPPPAPTGDWRRALTGRIAAYAYGRDYHDVLTGKMADLAKIVTEACGGKTRGHVDSGPLVEKHLARRAGLGWYGHNTNLLSRTGGSYSLLACILCEARFEPDSPFQDDHCGTCRACVPACPTGALDEGPTIDAQRCISYLTIEHRGPIALELRAPMGNWIFGCDVCQEVCPWNREAAPRDEFLEPYLPDVLSLVQEEFRARYGGTAVARAKRRGLARNAAVALGNSRNPEAVEPLWAALWGHDEPLVRSHAAWALGRIGTPAAIRALESAAAREAIPPVRAEIDAALTVLAATSPY